VGLSAPPAQRLGVFGGAFDPPHNAHVALVETAVAQLRLDELRVFPTGQAWHKPRALSPAADRLAMARLAFGGLARVVVDERETLRPGPTYTVDTLRELQAERPGAQLFLVIGADQAAALAQWHDYQDILRIAIISVAERAPSGPAGSMPAPENAWKGRFEALQMPPLSVSATDIRQRAAAYQGIAHLVPEGVARYIDQHHLYRTA
jgi:nicotinate-nucleotide adenylyltransferase